MHKNKKEYTYDDYRLTIEYCRLVFRMLLMYVKVSVSEWFIGIIYWHHTKLYEFNRDRKFKIIFRYTDWTRGYLIPAYDRLTNAYHEMEKQVSLVEEYEFKLKIRDLL